MDEKTPIAWTALERGTPIVASDGIEIGRVKDVIADEQKDIFSGLTYSPSLTERDRFVPADVVDSIRADSVSLTIASAQAERLEPFEQ